MHCCVKAIPFPVQLDGNCFALLLAAAPVVASSVAIAEAVVCIVCSPAEGIGFARIRLINTALLCYFVPGFIVIVSRARVIHNIAVAGVVYGFVVVVCGSAGAVSGRRFALL